MSYEELKELVEESEKEVQDEFKKIEELEFANSKRVIDAFQKYNFSDAHFGSTTGYGYDDIGRDTIEKVFAQVLGAEDAYN